MTSRRAFIKLGTTTGLLASPLTRLSFADSKGEARYIFIMLRGGMDGLAAVAPYGDSHYTSIRGALGLRAPAKENGVLELNGFFGLHPSLENLHSMYSNNEAVIIHAVASPYRDRSHFDGQKLLENGTAHPLGARDGWLNRSLAMADNQLSAIAMSQKVPLVLYGDQQVNSWAPAVLPETHDDTLKRVMRMYQQDTFLSTQLQAAIETRDIADDMSNPAMRNRRGRGIGQLNTYVEAAGKFLVDPDGPRIAVLEISGWDTHANQGNVNGQLANQLKDLDQGLGTLKKSLGSYWDNTVITVVTEFGRTADVNGTNGTDHGTASAAFVVGGAVQGGKMITDWPGLNKTDLYQGRDLKPTLDMRSVFKTVLHEHMHISRAHLEKRVFPDSQQAPLIPDLIQV